LDYKLPRLAIKKHGSMHAHFIRQMEPLANPPYMKEVIN